ncbi:MAG: IS1595 family transposase [Acetobacterales bacterium]
MDLTNPIFHNVDAARKHLEAIMWPEGPVCPHCGETENVKRLAGKSHRPGLCQCNSCRKNFTVTVGTVLERSKIPLNKWVLAFHLLASSKKGMSAHQLHRSLGVTYKTAWFMAHRIREAMREINPGPLGGGNKVVEADETYVGGKARNAQRGAPVPKKEAVIALLERDGRVRSTHVPSVNHRNLRPILVSQVDRKSYLMTDEAPVYKGIGKEYAGHGSVNHSIDEYVRGSFWHTNTVESYFSIMKRGINGVYQHVSQQHLKRYLGEFDFRYNERKVSDAERALIALKGIEGKRLTYRRTDEARHA